MYIASVIIIPLRVPFYILSLFIMMVSVTAGFILKILLMSISKDNQILLLEIRAFRSG